MQELELLQEGDRVMQKNEGQWQFSLDESSDGRSIELAISICRYLDTSLIRADVQPQIVRLLIQVCLIYHSHAYPVRLPRHLTFWTPAGAGWTPLLLCSRCSGSVSTQQTISCSCFCSILQGKQGPSLNVQC